MKKSKLGGWQGMAVVAVGWLALAVAKGIQFLLNPAYRNGFDAFLLAAWVFFAAAYARKAFRLKSAGDALDREENGHGGRHE